MKFITEVDSGNRKKILIIDKTASSMQQILKHELDKYDNNVFVSPKLLPNIATFDMCFIINESFTVIRHLLEENKESTATRLIFIFTQNLRTSQTVATYIQQFYPGKRYKYKSISIASDTVELSDLEKIIWFSLSESNETHITIQTRKEESVIPQIPHKPIKKKYAFKKLTFKQYLLYFFVFLLFLHLSFIPPLLIAHVFLYKATKTAKVNFQQSINPYNSSHIWYGFSKQLYNFIRPTFQLLSVALVTDSVFQLDDAVFSAYDKAITLYSSADAMTKLILKKDKSTVDLKAIETYRNKLSADADDFYQYVTILTQKLPNWQQLAHTRDDLKELAKDVQIVQSLLPHLDSLLAKDTHKKYLLLFANNMELRPGGGFIGSFGILSVHNYPIDQPKIYDVYDADGQLHTHIDPPAPIRQYLQQPHWFLRDSAFSPDFPTNYAQAKFFLDQELQESQFDGGILVTTTTIQNILEGMGDVYIPEFKETVNKNNFYIKAQMYSEKNFFPGSTQKKRFLGSVADQILFKLDQVPQASLLRMIQKSLEEKQMVIHFDDDQLQDSINSLYWSGKTLTPKCPPDTSNCVNNYLFPFEANLGVNKANFFVKKLIAIKSVIHPDGTADTKLLITLTNQSINDIFPGGTYKDYFQTMLPNTAVISKITKNDTLIDTYDSADGDNKLIGFYLEIPPQKTTKIEIDYSINTGLDNGKGAYQLVVQKQIGSPNSQLQLDVSVPSNMHIVSQNFSPLVKRNEILYNTSLSADKIFFIDLYKE